MRQLTSHETVPSSRGRTALVWEDSETPNQHSSSLSRNRLPALTAAIRRSLWSRSFYVCSSEEPAAAGAPSAVFDGAAEGPSGVGQSPACLRTEYAVSAAAVAEEAERHGDLLMVPGTDVYSRLPDKLLGFFNWLAPIGRIS